MMKQFYLCGLYQYQLTIVGTHSQPKMALSPLIATWRVYRLLQAVTSRFAGTAEKIQLPVHKMLLLGAPTLKCCSRMDFNGTHNNGKDLLTNRKDPWAESKDLKINFQGLKKMDPGNLARCFTRVHQRATCTRLPPPPLLRATSLATREDST